MKHLTLYVLCLLMSPVYAQKGFRAQLNKEINVQSNVKSKIERFSEAKSLQKSGKSTQKFTWDEFSNQWSFAGSYESIYNTDKELQEEIIYDVTGQANQRIVYSISASKLINSSITDINVDGLWEHQNKSEFEKDNTGNTIREEYFYWSDNNWVLTNGKKSVRENISANQYTETDLAFDDNTKMYLPIMKRIYNISNGKTDEIISQEFNNNNWNNLYAEAYDYNASGEITGMFYLTWNGAQWENKELYTNINWHDYAKKQLNTIELKVWKNETWVSDQKAVFQYKMNGGVSSISFVNIDNEWVYSYRLNEDYDMHNNPKSYKVEMYENNAWTTLMESEMEYTYDQQNRLVESIITIYDGSAWHNLSKEVITYKTNTGIAQQKAELKVYPNPTTDFIQLNMKEASAGTLNIYNVSGQLLISQHIENTEEARVNLNELTAGTYIVNFICGYEVLVTKIVKE